MTEGMASTSGVTEAQLREGLAQNPGRVIGAEPNVPTASVAAIARQGTGDDVELLFIERATKAGDPWSGQMAFPGGRTEPTDADTAATAERETSEEIGLDLADAGRLGRIDDLDGGRATNRRIIVSAHVYWLGVADPQLAPNYEVADTIWVPSSRLLNPDSYEDYTRPSVPDQVFPSVRVGDGGKVIWGLTFRMLEDLFVRLDRRFPGRR